MGAVKSLVFLASLSLCGNVLGDSPFDSGNHNHGRYIVKFSQNGSAKFKRSDGTHVGDTYLTNLFVYYLASN